MDPFIALLSYRSTPLPWCNLSPAELCMGRKVRSTIPQLNHHLVPKWSYMASFRKQNATFKDKQKENYDNRHRVRALPTVPEDTEVWVTVGTGAEQVRGTVTSAASTPRSYLVDIPSGEIRRNRSQIRVVPEESPRESNNSSPEQQRAEGDTQSNNSPPEQQRAEGDTQPGTQPNLPPSNTRRPVTRSQTGSTPSGPDYLSY